MSQPPNRVPPAAPQQMQFSSPQQMLAFFEADLMVHMLTGAAMQMKLIGQEAPSFAFQTAAEKITEWRNEWHRREQSRVIVAGPGDLPARS